MKSDLKFFYKQLDELYQLGCIDQLLGWDEQVIMPAGGEKSRTKQLELAATLIHQRKTEPAFTSVVDELAGSIESLSHDDQVNVRETKRIVDNARKFSEEFIAEKTRAHSEAYASWIKARPANDFEAVVPYLQKNIDLARKEAELLGYNECPYDALLDMFEPGSRYSIVKPALTAVADELSNILPKILKKSKERTFEYHSVHCSLQKAICERACKDLGYGLDTGRLDTAPHPFMTSIGPRDTRITTRYEEENYLSSLLTTLHEAGHGLYELGFEEKHYGTPRGDAVSLSIHESQSRFYENIIGRSRAYATYLYNMLGEIAPEVQAATDETEIWNTLNNIESSLIRVEADEVTYSLHVVIRMIIEGEIINDGLQAKEVSQRWNELYKEYLDIDVPNDTDGVLQDVHWFHVGFGYFPTYALGNLYGGLMLDKLKSDLPNYNESVAAGEFSEILTWLRTNIHTHGMTYNSPEIAVRLSGKQLSHEPFLTYIKEKHEIV